ncbi:MAG: VanZ family protein [bacterium]|nr:VanZ family protein [bacterium]
MESPFSKRRRWITAYAPLAIWVAVIIGLGSGLGAMNETSRFIRPLLEFLFPSTPPEILRLYHGYIRKLAHVTEYAILAILARRAFAEVRAPSLMAIGVVLLVAAADELNQSFDPRRTGTPVDVLIDLAGGIIGLAIWWIVSRLFRGRN